MKLTEELKRRIDNYFNKKTPEEMYKIAKQLGFSDEYNESWISVEKPPTEYKLYNVIAETEDETIITSLYYNTDKKTWEFSGTDGKSGTFTFELSYWFQVTHWQELPKLY